MKIGIISLGCPRNLTDSETMLGSLKKEGFAISDVGKGVDVCIINTCSFIQSAREESVDAILDAARLKKEKKIKYLVVCGCLPQLYKDRLAKELPEADLILGTSDIPKIASFIKELRTGKRRLAVSDSLDYLYDGSSPRFLLTPSHYAYIKISEGCSNLCSYCVIPRLKGPFRSRAIESVIKEAGKLSTGGRLKEINLIGQDTTLFGIDRYGKPVLSELLKRLCALKNSVRWIRLLYTHPGHYTDELISTIRDEARICRYLDLPLQHIADNILRKMNRHTARKDIIELIEKLRKNIPGLAIRTSIIVGFPGETDKEFKELLEFIRETRFERLGAFIYSREESTRAAGFERHVPEKIKKERFDELMKAQQGISLEMNRSLIGKTIDVLVDEKNAGEDSGFLGRTEHDAPEIDCAVYVSGKSIKTGEFRKVRVTAAMEYDLAGEAI